MLDEHSLRRLAEMGIDAYVPRAAPRPELHAAQPASGNAGICRVMLLAETNAPATKTLTAQVARALKFARVECTQARMPEESALAEVAGLIVFGESLARRAGALLPATRPQAMVWVAAPDAAVVARDAHAKRALWSELKRMVRTVQSTKG